MNQAQRAARLVRLRRRAWNGTLSVVRGVFLAGICFVVLYPMLSKVFFSFMDISDVFNPNRIYLPRTAVLDNYRAAIEIMDYGRSLLHTILLSISAAAVQLAASMMVGYGLARFRFKGRNVLFIALIVVMVIPPDLLLLPRYFQFRFFDPLGLAQLFGGGPLSLIDTFVPFWLMGLTCTGIKNGLYVFIFRQHFLGLPLALEEAAEVDGAGPVRTFLRIVVPGSMNTVLTVFLFSMVWQWNDSVYSPVFLYQTGVLTNAIGKIPSKAAAALGVSTIDMASSLVVSAGVLMMIVPMLILYAIAQRFFAQSVEKSGLVG